MVLAAFIFLHFIAAIRSVLGSAESPVRGSAQLARVAYAGALTGIVAMTMAFVTLAAASSEGADANPVVSRAVTTASAGPFLVAAMGFAAFLMAAGVLTLRSGVFARATKFLLGLSVNPSNETVPLSLQGCPYPGDLYDVHSDSHDHSGLSNSTEESPGAFRCSVNLL